MLYLEDCRTVYLLGAYFFVFNFVIIVVLFFSSPEVWCQSV